MQLMQYRITVKNPVGSAGPGAFLIMKAAYDNGVKGECRYSGLKYFAILAEGEKPNLLIFMDEVRNVFPGSKMSISLAEEIASLHFSEFDIMEHFNNEFEEYQF